MNAPVARAARRARPLRPVATAAVAALTGALVLPSAPAAHADQAAQRPASGGYTLTGHGFGHGRGMSQWGAYGAAESGLSWTQILDFYYPGTARSDIGNPTIRVLLVADGDGNTTVEADPGLAVTVGSTRRTLPSGPGYRRWRANASGGRIALQYQDALGAWRASTVAAAGTEAAFTTASGRVRVVLPSGTREEIRGDVRAALSGGKVVTVASMPMETYLRGVVASEMPSSWHTQALAAQSVAARTYATAYRANQRAKGSVWDICDTTTCQVYKGVSLTSASGYRDASETSRTDTAIAATAGTVLRTKAGNLAYTEFSASNGGYIAAGDVSYQVAKRDPYDAKMRNPNTTWSTSVPVARLESTFGVGTLRSVQVLTRNGLGADGGRVLTMRLTGSARSVVVSGAKVRSALGLRSDWFTVAPTAPTRPAGTTPTPAPAPTTSSTARVRDFDGSRRPDLLAVERDGGLVLRDIGPDLQLEAPRAVGRGWLRMSDIVAAGRLDRAGGDDLLAKDARTGTLTFYPGTGDGGFGRARTVGTGWGPYTSLTGVGDADGDGRADVVAVRAASKTLVLASGRGDGRLAPARVVATRWTSTRVVGVGDLTGDGRVDLAAVGPDNRLRIFRGDGKGGFGSPVVLGSGWNAYVDLTSPGDVTGDGVPDLVAVDRAGQAFLYRGAKGSFGARRSLGAVSGTVRLAR